MDKDLLRMVIIAVGAVVIIGMVLWGLLRERSKRNGINFYDNHDPLDNIDPSLVVSTEDDDFEIVPLSTGDNNGVQVKTRLNSEYVQDAQRGGVEDSDHAQRVEPEQAIDGNTPLPTLIQLSIVAKKAEGFTGIQLLEACENVGLIYGSVKVFEKLDDLNQVDYAVASMAEPGVFPDDDWENYVCPGVTFFMQPREVGNAAQVFAEMIETIGQLSLVLQGEVLDQNQQTLTEDALQQLKASLV